MLDKQITLYKILETDEGYTFSEIKKAVNSALKKEDDGCWSYVFMKELRKFNLQYLVGNNKLDTKSIYKLNSTGASNIGLEVIKIR